MPQRQPRRDDTGTAREVEDVAPPRDRVVDRAARAGTGCRCRSPCRRTTPPNAHTGAALQPRHDVRHRPRAAGRARRAAAGRPAPATSAARATRRAGRRSGAAPRSSPCVMCFSRPPANTTTSGSACAAMRRRDVVEGVEGSRQPQQHDPRPVDELSGRERSDRKASVSPKSRRWPSRARSPASGSWCTRMPVAPASAAPERQRTVAVADHDEPCRRAPRAARGGLVEEQPVGGIRRRTAPRPRHRASGGARRGSTGGHVTILAQACEVRRAAHRGRRSPGRGDASPRS